MYRIILFLLVALVVVVFGGDGERVSAQSAANYAVEYSSTNLYTGDQILIYNFTGLDPNSNYVWLLQSISDESVPMFAMAQKYFGDGVSTSTTITFFGADFDGLNGTVYTGPARVIDNYGNVLGTHFLLGGCVLTCGNGEWGGVGGVNGTYNRVGIGKFFHTIPRNADGYFHPYTSPNMVTTKVGDYTLLHYRYDPASVPNADKYEIYDLVTGSVLYTYYLSDLFAYNRDKRNFSLGISVETINFVVLSTNGIVPSFINAEQNASAWLNGDNPFEASFSTGVYDYARVTSIGTPVDDGESVFVVSDGGIEWKLSTAQENILAGRTLRVKLESDSVGVWNSGYFDSNLSDSTAGQLDANDYAYSSIRSYSFLVVPYVVDSILTWTITPTLSNMVAVTLAMRRFDVSISYSIAQNMLVRDRVEETLSGFGMDTPLGRTLGMLALIFVVMVFVASQGGRGFVPASLVFLMGGGVWLAVGMGDAITTIIYAISAIVILFLLVNGRSNANGGVS